MYANTERFGERRRSPQGGIVMKSVCRVFTFKIMKMQQIINLEILHTFISLKEIGKKGYFEN